MLERLMAGAQVPASASAAADTLAGRTIATAIAGVVPAIQVLSCELPKRKDVDARKVLRPGRQKAGPRCRA
jgi:hypothetical protein